MRNMLQKMKENNEFVNKKYLSRSIKNVLESYKKARNIHEVFPSTTRCQEQHFDCHRLDHPVCIYLYKYH